MSTRWWEKFDDMYSRLDTIPGFELTEGRTTVLKQYRALYMLRMLMRDTKFSQRGYKKTQ